MTKTCLSNIKNNDAEASNSGPCPGGMAQA